MFSSQQPLDEVHVLLYERVIRAQHVPPMSEGNISRYFAS